MDTCRTCGFTHPDTDCPRWPAREAAASGLFDMLTLAQLNALHTSLYLSMSRIHLRMCAPDGSALIPVFGPDWLILRAAHDDMHDTMDAVYAEIGARNALAAAYPLAQVPSA